MSLGTRGVGFGPLLLRQWRLKRGLLIPLPRCLDVRAKVLNSSEDAHLKTTSTFETNEHLRG